MNPASASPLRRPGRSAAAIAVFGLLTAISYLFAQFWYALGQPWGPGASAMLAVAYFFVHLAFIRRRISAVDPVLWVPVVMFLFYFGGPVAVGVFGVSPSRAYQALSVPISPSLSRGYATALLTFACLLWGIHLAGLVGLARARRSEGPSSDRSLAQAAMIMTLGGYVMLAAGVAILGPSAVFGTYSDYWDAKTYGGDPRFFDMGIVFLQAGIFGMIATYDRSRKFRTVFIGATVLFLAVAAIQNGTRSFLISLAMGCAWCYSQRVRRIPFSLTVAMAVVVLLLLPILARYRVEKTIDNATPSSLVELTQAAVSEMGRSGLAFAYTLDFVPSEKNYSYGYSFLGAVLELVPNVGLSPGGAQLFRIRDVESKPSAWITKTLAPEYFAGGGGFGFTMGAEWYFNFGMLGIVVGVTLCGYLLTRLRNASQHSALALVASALAFAAMSIYVRNEIGMPLKMLAWPVFGLWVITKVTEMLRGPSARRPRSDPSQGTAEATRIHSRSPSP